jgi:hypothetical protein
MKRKQEPVEVGISLDNGVMMLAFGADVNHLLLTKEDALAFAEMIKRHAKTMKDEPVDTFTVDMFEDIH